MKRPALLAIALFTTLVTIPAASHADTEVRRRVLALYKGSEGDTPARNQTAALLEQPLESLGIVVDYADAENDLPSPDVMRRYRGVVTFFRGPVMTDARTYLSWLGRQASQGRKVVIMGEIGAMQDRASGAFVTHAELSRTLAPLGIRFDGLATTDRSRIELLNATAQMSFEEPFTEDRIRSYQRVRPLGSSATAYLVLSRTDLEDGNSSPVLTTASGGYAARDFLLYEYTQGGIGKQRWHLDPFAFLTAALDLGNEPRFDAASLNGRRLWMAHIDGDGLITPAASGLLCGQVILDRILSVYRSPISVSVVSSDLDRDPRAVNMAKAIFALGHVEAASHSANHPMDWSAPGLDLASEIDGSVTSLTGRVLPEGKKIGLFTWTGLCNPPAAALSRLAAMGIAGINGINAEGGFVNRLDRLYPSRSNLAPMTRQIHGQTQISHRAANDYELTDGWKEDRRDGYEGIIETFERTASRPEIPAHAYFHFYSGETLASLRAIENVMEWARRNPVSPIFVSDYVRLVEDFRSATIVRDAQGRMVVSNAGACRTIVFPDTDRHVDFARSENVVGYAVRNNRLHVFLDGERRHVIALSDSEPTQANVASAAGWIDRFEATGDAVSLDMRAWGDTEISLRVPGTGAYAISIVSRADERVQPAFETAAEAVDGRLTFTYPATGRDTITIQPTSRASASARRAGFPLLALSLAAFPVWALVRTRRRLEP